MTSFQNRIDEMERQMKKQNKDGSVRPRPPHTLDPLQSNFTGLASGSSGTSSPVVSSLPQSCTSPAMRSIDLPLIAVNTAPSSDPRTQLFKFSSPTNVPRASVDACSGSHCSKNLTSNPGDIVFLSGLTQPSSVYSGAGTHPSLGIPVRPIPPGKLTGGPSDRKLKFNLPLDPASQIQHSSNGDEIERRYAEIMKQAGVLTLNGMKVPCDISELERIGELGQGTCGHVVKMLHQKTGQVMAVKQMRKSGNSEDNRRIIMDLDVVMKSHSCPYIVQCIGTFITGTDVWICMELMATCLDKLSKSLADPIPEKILGKVTVATVNALNYLKESHGVIHRDVKPSNILLDERGMIKLCDFGISGHLVDSKAKTRSAGCAAYMAPERIVPPDPSKPDYDIRADVWSLGLSLVELATGEFPYKNCKTDFEMLTKVLEDERPVLPSGKNFSMDFQDFVSQCLTKDYHKRPKYKKLLEHNFVHRYSSLNVDVANWYRTVMQKTEEQDCRGSNLDAS